ncbi:fumarylacetoacetate hydrolase family protein [Luminiphilus sp.]|jgi:2-keto-4-pentenoate hydratase/2-oxohepta-3-ene-1,7-dioic acid hydratase in catechol pathway|nr:fumarylacetoacetate hydrolase family protein [Halieaceae bacterium]MCH1579955.1 fumarylacetoacetate hydrolase family protein [Luminiphilus sp.]MDC0573388.1 fumarylacetoacetate hydrolase family protein [Luminiphilus sp.]MDC6472775.1 fumarylacetoacetate hydrolase family protein [Luminiphilus sp.]MDG1215894.1 fumarylacetoacetate hydrolase family protein [Luminiphilus sp.]
MTAIQFNGKPVRPGKVICVGKNYAAHISEMDSVPAENMVVFMKPATSIGTELHAVLDEPLHYEGEICLLVQHDNIAGIGFGLDLTKRETQSKLKAAGLPWERSKAFTGSALFSEFVQAPEDLSQLGLELRVNDALRQKGDVSLMLYPLAVILEELRQFLTLEDGDIIMTGTPAGVGPVQSGECFDGRVLAGEQVLAQAVWQAH